jgi:hypothetical protein
LKRIGFLFGSLMVIIVVFIFIIKSYPPLPVDNLSAKEVIEKLEESDHKIVEIAVDDDTIWYLTRTENKGILIADKNIKQLVGSKEWEFKEKAGSGLFFEKDGERLIATTQMWTKKYVLVKIQRKFKIL